MPIHLLMDKFIICGGKLLPRAPLLSSVDWADPRLAQIAIGSLTVGLGGCAGLRNKAVRSLVPGLWLSQKVKAVVAVWDNSEI